MLLLVGTVKGEPRVQGEAAYVTVVTEQWSKGKKQEIETELLLWQLGNVVSYLKDGKQAMFEGMCQTKNSKTQAIIKFVKLLGSKPQGGGGGGQQGGGGQAL